MNVARYVTRGRQLPDFETESRVTLDSTRVIQGLLGVYAFSVVMMALTQILPSVVTAPFVVLSLSFVPGTLLLVALGREELSLGAAHVLYAFGSSLLVLMFVGALANILLPLWGVAKPLMPVPLGVSVTAAVALLAAVAWWRNPSGTVSARLPPLWSPHFFAFLLLPLLSIIGVSLINATGISVLLVGVLVAIGAVPVVAVWRLDDRWYAFAIWTTTLAILYHKSLWKYAGFGGRPHGIKAWEAGRWSPGVLSIDPYTSELLQNGVLFPLFARLSDIFIMTQYEVVNPLFVSFLPLALYVAFRQYVRTDVALLGAAIFAFAHPFYYQYPTAGRAATPVIFLALFGVALSNKELSSGSRAALAVAFLSGIVVTHYGTSYYVAAALVIAFVLVAALRFVDSVAGEYLQRVAPVSDGGTTARGRAPTLNRSSIFSLSTVLFFISAALGWYLYMRQGWKFSLLPKHIFDNLMTLVRGSAGGGRTAARVQESYTSPSIQISKYIYILVAVLIAVGLAVVYYRRIVTRESSFDDHYLAIGTGLFGIFATTLILSNWGGGRPMMVTFSFTTVFAAVGAMWVADVGKRIATVAGRKVPSVATEGHTLEGRPIGATVFAVILLAFFVLNSGVAAATVFDGLAPSNVPAQSDLVTSDGPQRQVTVHRETDIVTHVWLVRHLDDRYDVYGDTYGARQYDWYRPDVAARTPSIGGGYTSATKPGVLSVDAQRAGTQPGYILVMGHNLELQAVWPGKFVSGTSLDELSLSRRNRIYSTGESHVYFYATADQPTAEDSDPSSEG